LIKKSQFMNIASIALVSTFALSACTNPTSEAGSVNAYYDGVITGMEAIDLDNNQQDSTTNTIIGGVVGALLGNAVNGHSTGTAVGAGLGLLAGSGISKLADRSTGIRLSVDTDNGPLIVDMPFSCKYGVGKKVRLISGSSTASVMVEENGKYVTATQDKTSKCPALLQEIQVN